MTELSRTLKIYFGPYEKYGIIRHKTQKLYGIINHFTEIGYDVEIIPIKRLNAVIIHYNGKEIFRCDIRYLMFNVEFEDDPVAQNLAKSVEETCARFESEDNVPTFETDEQTVTEILEDDEEHHFRVRSEGLEVVFEVLSVRWTYQNQKAWPPACKGNFQSPIDIQPNNTIKADFGSFVFSEDFYRGKNAIITNTGHTVEIKIIDDSHPVITGGGLEGEYVMASFHFHWPAEHKLDGYRFPMEGHFLFHSKEHENLQAALEFENAVTALAVFYNVTPVGNPVFKNLVDSMHSIAYSPNKNVVLKNLIRVYEFLPQNKSTFFRYQGTLTVPKCNPAIWTVFMQASHISKRQYESLTKIWDEDNKLVEFNAREVQDLNDRTVWLNT